MEATSIAPTTGSATDLRLARVHLRMGLLGLARAELEALAGSGDLDDGGLLALAEARWRTGDITGAGEAAQAYLSSGAEDVTALVIAAEAVASVGRPGEARRIAGRALDQAETPLDRIFAGMPRSSIWPADPADAGQPTLFGPDLTRRIAPADRDAGAAEEQPALDRPTGPGFWDADAAAATAPPDAAALLEAGGRALHEGRTADARLPLALALRMAPELAPAILALTEPLSRRSADVELIRGDAFRLVGRDRDARRSWHAAAEALGRAEGRTAPP